jgi:hypothetical protein
MKFMNMGGLSVFFFNLILSCFIEGFFFSTGVWIHHLLHRCSNTWAMPWALFASVIFGILSTFLFRLSWTTILTILKLIRSLVNFLPRVSSKHDPLDLYLLSSCDYRCEPLHLAKSFHGSNLTPPLLDLFLGTFRLIRMDCFPDFFFSRSIIGIKKSYWFLYVDFLFHKFNEFVYWIWVFW